VGFIVTALTGTNRAVVHFYNQRGTAEQCLGVIAYNLGNLLRRLVLPVAIQGWSLTSLQQRLFKTGGRLIRHARSFVLQLAESSLTGSLLSADSRAHRATRVAPDVIPNTGQGTGAMSSGGRRGGGVSERDRRRDQTRKHWVAPAPGFARRTPIDLSGGLNELTDGTDGSVDTVTGAGMSPYRKFR
jgi:hypothetical protein